MFILISVLTLCLIEQVLIPPNKFIFGMFMKQFSVSLNTEEFMISHILTACNLTQLISTFIVPSIINKYGLINIKLISATAVFVAQILGSLTDQYYLQMFAQSFMQISIAITDISIPITVKLQFDPKYMSIINSLIKTISGIGIFLQSQIQAILLKEYHYQYLLVIAGIIIDSCLLMYVFIPSHLTLKPKKEETLIVKAESENIIAVNGAVGDDNLVLEEQETFYHFLCKPQVMLGNVALFLFQLQQKTLFDWSIKMCIHKGFTWDEGAALIHAFSVTSVAGRIGSGFLGMYLGIDTIQMGAFIISSICQISIGMTESYTVIQASAIIYGFCPGAVSAQLGTLAKVLQNDKFQNDGVGVIFTIIGTSVMVGGYISIQIIQQLGQDALFLCIGMILVLASLLNYISSIFRNREIKLKKMRAESFNKKKQDNEKIINKERIEN